GNNDRLSFKANTLVTPVPVRSFNGASNDIEALVSSLETPRFRESSAEQFYDDGNTLVNPVPRKRARYSAAEASASNADNQHLFATPTRSKAADSDDHFVGSERMNTLVQPVRSKRNLEALSAEAEKLPFNFEEEWQMLVNKHASASQHSNAEASETS
ncbi:hypothetical protein IWW36_003618, partial [Coemansia brasiliensis]